MNAYIMKINLRQGRSIVIIKIIVIITSVILLQFTYNLFCQGHCYLWKTESWSSIKRRHSDTSRRFCKHRLASHSSYSLFVLKAFS